MHPGPSVSSKKLGLEIISGSFFSRQMGPSPSERISIFCVHNSGSQLDNTGPHLFPKQPQFCKFDMQNYKVQLF